MRWSSQYQSINGLGIDVLSEGIIIGTATIGGVVHIAGQGFGMTVRHAFSDILEVIAARLAHRDYSARRAAVDILRHQSPLPDSMLRTIGAGLKHQDWSIREAAVGILAKQPNIPDDIFEAIAARLDDREGSVRLAAFDALGKQLKDMQEKI